jgi:hypothetical protein
MFLLQKLVRLNFCSNAHHNWKRLPKTASKTAHNSNSGFTCLGFVVQCVTIRKKNHICVSSPKEDKSRTNTANAVCVFVTALCECKMASLQQNYL